MSLFGTIPRPQSIRRGFTLIEVMIAITIIAILVAILVPSFKRARARAQLSSCVTQCKTLSTALELYAVDNAGRFPVLSGGPGVDILITNNYIKRRPICPSAGTFTFVDYQSTITPDSFSFSCVSNNHGDNFPGLSGNNLPSYNSGFGVLDHP